MAEVVEPLDLEKELEEVIRKAEPDLKDALKRGFTNVAVQKSSMSEDDETPVSLSDVFYVDNDGNQISLSNLAVYGCTAFHLSRLDLSLAGMKLSVAAGAGNGALIVEAAYRAACPALQALLPATADGRIRVIFSGVKVDGTAGLEIKDDSLYILNTDLSIHVDEVNLNVFHYVPKPNGGDEMVTSQVSKNSLDKLPLVQTFTTELFYRVQRELVAQLNEVLQRTTSVSEILGENHQLIETFSTRVALASSSGNAVVDVILMEVRKNLLQKRCEVVRLPNMQANFSKKIGLITWQGEFETIDGWLLDLSTIDRTNDVTLTQGVSKSSMMVSMGLSKMRVGFDEYRLKFMKIGPTGRIEAIIGENSIHMKISAGVNKWRNFATIDELKIEYFGDVDIHITGLGPLNWLVSTISTWVSGHIKNIAIPMMETQIKAELQKAIDCINVWELVSKTKS